MAKKIEEEQSINDIILKIEKLTNDEKKQVTGGSFSEHIILLKKAEVSIMHDCDPNDTSCHPDDYWDCGHNEYNDVGYCAYEDYNDRS